MSQQSTINTMTMMKAVSILLTIGALIVSATVFVASRPTRDEVRQMIDDRVAYRLQSIDERLERIEDKLAGHPTHPSP